MNQRNQTLGVLVTVIAGLAFLDGLGESNILYGLIGAALAVVGPVSCAYITVHRSRKSGNITSTSYQGPSL